MGTACCTFAPLYEYTHLQTRTRAHAKPRCWDKTTSWRTWPKTVWPRTNQRARTNAHWYRKSPTQKTPGQFFKLRNARSYFLIALGNSRRLSSEIFVASQQFLASCYYSTRGFLSPTFGTKCQHSAWTLRRFSDNLLSVPLNSRFEKTVMTSGTLYPCQFLDAG